MSHLGFPLEKIKGDGDGDHPNNDSPVFLAVRVTVTLRLPPNCSTHGETTMNSEEKPWRWEKTERGEEILPVFLGEQQRRMAACPNLPSLLFLSLPPLYS